VGARSPRLLVQTSNGLRKSLGEDSYLSLCMELLDAAEESPKYLQVAFGLL
jgi:hypothetical protein